MTAFGRRLLIGEMKGEAQSMLRERKEKGNLLAQVRELQRILEFLQRDLIRQEARLASAKRVRKKKMSLYGCVKGGDITEEMIEEAKRSLFRELEDVG